MAYYVCSAISLIGCFSLHVSFNSRLHGVKCNVQWLIMVRGRFVHSFLVFLFSILVFLFSILVFLFSIFVYVFIFRFSIFFLVFLFFIFRFSIFQFSYFVFIFGFSIFLFRFHFWFSISILPNFSNLNLSFTFVSYFTFAGNRQY